MGFPAWREGGNGGDVTAWGVQRQLSQTLLRGEQRLLPERGIHARHFHGKITPAPGRGTVGRAVDDTAMVLLQHWEEKLGCVGFLRGSATPLVLSDGPVGDRGQISAAVGLGMK